MLHDMFSKLQTVSRYTIALGLIVVVGGCGSPTAPETDNETSRAPAAGEQAPAESQATDESTGQQPPTGEATPPADSTTEMTSESSAPTATEEPASETDSSATAPPDTIAGDTVPQPPPNLNAPPEIKPDPPGMQRLHEKYNVWVDPANKEVVMVSEVVLREGGLELFACLLNTKEHEAILAVDTEAFIVHAGLLAVGAEAGHPVIFRPEYQPAEGSQIEVLLEWEDPETGEKQTARAQDWVRNMETGEPMQENWVFGGSSFWEDEVTNQRYYLAEDGDLICVSNFHSAMLDVPIESSQSNDLLIYEAFTERVPPVGTEVWVRLKPVKNEDGGDTSAPPANNEGA